MIEKFVICVGNNSRNTDELTTEYARSKSSVNRGLVTDEKTLITEPGVYHTSFSDVNNVTDFLSLLKKFDAIVFFQQSKDSYADPYEYVQTSFCVRIASKKYKIPVETIDAEKA